MPRFYETTLSITNLHNLSISTHVNRSRIHTVDFFGGFEKFCYIRNPFTGNRLTCGRRNDAATLLPSPVETFFCNFLI